MRTLVLAGLLGLLGCTATPATARLVPGERLGGLRLLARMETVDSLLGPPVYSDSGAGTTVARYRTVVGGDSVELLLILTFEPTDDMRKDLQVARTVARVYRDTFDLGVGSSLEAFSAHYTLDGPLASYATGADSVQVYDTGNGLAVEIDRAGVCRGVAVHVRDRYPTVNYRPDYPEMAVREVTPR